MKKELFRHDGNGSFYCGELAIDEKPSHCIRDDTTIVPTPEFCGGGQEAWVPLAQNPERFLEIPDRSNNSCSEQAEYRILICRGGDIDHGIHLMTHGTTAFSLNVIPLLFLQIYYLLEQK